MEAISPRFFVFQRAPDVPTCEAMRREDVRAAFAAGRYGAHLDGELEQRAFANWLERATPGAMFLAPRLMAFAVGIISAPPWVVHSNGEVT